MSAQDVAVVVLGIIGAVAAIRLVTSQNVVHAALYLVLTLAMVGAMYLLIGLIPVFLGLMAPHITATVSDSEQVVPRLAEGEVWFQPPVAFAPARRGRAI